MSVSRLLFIHGNLDVPTSFDGILPLLPDVPAQCVDLEAIFTTWNPATPVTAQTVAERLIHAYSIGPGDVLIGHSMGGWIGAYAKEMTGARLIQLSSWTDPRKIKSPIRRLGLIRFIINSGVVQHRLSIGLAKKLIPFSKSRARVQASLDRLQQLNPAYIMWQYKLIFTSVPPLTITPDLRIHDRRDFVISPPDEPFVNVPGNHQLHANNPPGVAEAIRSFLA